MKMTRAEQIQLALNANNQERRRSVSRAETRVTAELFSIQAVRRAEHDPV